MKSLNTAFSFAPPSILSLTICGGKPDERKELSNSLRNDSLLDKLVDELAKGKAMEKIKRTNK